MVLGLIDFLLGGKKKAKGPNNTQTRPAQNSSQENNMQQSQVGNNQNTQQENQNFNQNNNNQNNNNQNNNLNFQDSNTQNSTQETQNTNFAPSNYNNSGTKKTISEVLNKIRLELKETNENIANLNTDMKEIQGTVNSLDHRISDLEEKNTKTDDSLNDINSNMSKFLSLYELVNNQYNPFIDKESEPEKKIILNNDGSQEFDSENQDKIQKLDISNYTNFKPNPTSQDNLKNSLLELDTLNIEEAASNAVPLTNIKNNTNSLVIILSWLEYLVKRVGVNESKNTLRYYTETLKWITPEVFFELDKFLRGMEDIENEKKSKFLDVKDHIVSLYFISKLNEKTLDEKLTKAVLQIINNE